MAVVKTAVSIERHLFDEGEELARKWKVSRSELYARALSDLIRLQRRREIQERINAVEASLTNEDRREEQSVTEGMRRMTSEALRATARSDDAW